MHSRSTGNRLACAVFLVPLMVAGQNVVTCFIRKICSSPSDVTG